MSIMKFIRPRTTKTKQWLWFISLWLLSLSTVLVITYPIKWLINASLAG